MVGPLGQAITSITSLLVTVQFIKYDLYNKCSIKSLIDKKSTDIQSTKSK